MFFPVSIEFALLESRLVPRWFAFTDQLQCFPVNCPGVDVMRLVLPGLPVLTCTTLQCRRPHSCRQDGKTPIWMHVSGYNCLWIWLYLIKLSVPASCYGCSIFFSVFREDTHTGRWAFLTWLIRFSWKRWQSRSTSVLLLNHSLIILPHLSKGDEN